VHELHKVACQCANATWQRIFAAHHRGCQLLPSLQALAYASP
jgi:hypothetical protein